MVVGFWIQMTSIEQFVDSKHVHGGSQPGKAPNVHRDYSSVHLHYMHKYFWPTSLARPNKAQTGPEQNKAAFERRFRMSRAIFDRVMLQVVSHSAYFR